MVVHDWVAFHHPMRERSAFDLTHPWVAVDLLDLTVILPFGAVHKIG